jgi:hypothetical protein
MLKSTDQYLNLKIRIIEEIYFSACLLCSSSSSSSNCSFVCTRVGHV